MSTSEATNAMRRANITAYLNSNPTEEFSLKELAAALDIPAKAMQPLLHEMAKNNLIASRKQGTAKMYRCEGSTPALEHKIERKAKKPRRITTAKDVELVVGGTMIVIGRNPDTGRLRIVVDDVA